MLWRAPRRCQHDSALVRVKAGVPGTIRHLAVIEKPNVSRDGPKKVNRSHEDGRGGLPGGRHDLAPGMVRLVATAAPRTMMATLRSSDRPSCPPWAVCTSSPRTPTGRAPGSNGRPNSACTSGSRRSHVPSLSSIAGCGPATCEVLPGSNAKLSSWSLFLTQCLPFQGPCQARLSVGEDSLTIPSRLER